MSKFFEGLVSASDASVEEQEERVTGVGGGLKESDVYKMRIKSAYMTIAPSGAKAIVFAFDDPKNPEGFPLNETIYFTANTENGGKNTYVKNGKTYFNPGYLKINALCQLITQKDLEQQAIETRSISQYNFKEKRDEIVEVDALVDLWGKDIILGILKETYNGYDSLSKSKTNECKERNTVDGFYDIVTQQTYRERKSGTPATLIFAFVKRWKGEVKNSYKELTAAGVKQGAPSAPAKAVAPVDTSALFAD